MSTEVQKWPEKKESQVPSREALEKSVQTSQKKPQEVAKAIEVNMTPEKILARYEIRLKWVQEWMKNIRTSRDENTWFFNVITDDVVGALWGDTGKALYESAHTSTKKLASEAIIQLDKDCRNIVFSGNGYDRYIAIRSQLEQCAWQKLWEPNSLLAIKNSVTDLPQATHNLMHGVVGEVKWGYNVMKGMVTGVADLTLFMGKYIVSWYQSMGWDTTNSEKMNAQIGQVFNQMGKVYDFVEQNGFSGMWDAVSKALKQEWDKIMALPPNKQADAIGQLAGNVIGALTLMKWGMMLAWKVSSLWGKTAQAERIAAKFAERWATGSKRAEQAAELGKEAARAKNVFLAADKILNGPAESLIGMALASTLNKTLILLKTAGVSSIEKIAQVRGAIKEMDQAIKDGTYPGKEAEILKVKEILEKEAKKLQAEARSGISPETVLKNANLSDTERLIEAEKILKEKGLMSPEAHLTSIEKAEILASHHSGKWVYENTTASLKAKVDAGKKAAEEAGWSKKDMLTAEKRRALMESGIMGMDESKALKQIVESAKIRPSSLEELKKTNSLLAKDIDTYLSGPNSKINLDRGTVWGDWADIILKKLEFLEKTNGKISPEYFQELQGKVHTEINTALGARLHSAVYGSVENIQSLKIWECFEKLEKHGFHVNPESLVWGDQFTGPRISLALQDALHRAEISTVGVSAKWKVEVLTKLLETERATLSKQLKSPDLTKEGFEEIKITLQKQRESLKEKIWHLQVLESDLGLLKNTNAQETDAKGKVSAAIKLLNAEVEKIARMEKGDALMAWRNINTREVKGLAEESKKTVIDKGVDTPKLQTEIIDSRNNRPISPIKNESAARALLQSNWEYVFNLLSAPTALVERRVDITTVFDFYLPKMAPEELKKQFTPEILAKFWRNPDFTKIGW